MNQDIKIKLENDLEMYKNGTLSLADLIMPYILDSNKLSPEYKCKEVIARIKAFLNDLLLAISSFIELLAPLFDLELIFKLLEKKHNLIPKLVTISIRDLAFIDQQLSDENQQILLG